MTGLNFGISFILVFTFAIWLLSIYCFGFKSGSRLVFLMVLIPISIIIGLWLLLIATSYMLHMAFGI